VNLAYVDINAGVTNHLIVLNDTDQTVAYQLALGQSAICARRSGYGHLHELRYSQQLSGRTFVMRPAYEVCVEFYDDPASRWSPVRTSDVCCRQHWRTALYTGPLYTLPGSGQWLKLAFWIPSVNLFGVNTAPYTGGPRLQFVGGFPSSIASSWVW